MIAVIALLVALISLAVSVASYFKEKPEAAQITQAFEAAGRAVSNRINALVQKHRNEVAPVHRTSLASVKDLISAAERESSRVRFK